MTTNAVTAGNMAEEIEAWCQRLYRQAIANGATDKQAIATLKSLFFEGVRR